MELRNNLDFYCPWPLFGVKLGQQWREIRADIANLRPTAKGTIIYADETPSFDPDCTKVLAGYEFGEQNFPNKFRLLWETGTNQFNFECNSGTTTSPTWDTAFYVDCDAEEVIFLKRAVFSGGNNLNDLTIDDGTRELIGQSRFSVNENNFYLDLDSSGDPKLNLIGDLTTEAFSGHFISVPDQDVTIEERAPYNYDIVSLTGATTTGDVDVTVSINGTTVGGLNAVNFGTSQSIQTATSSRRVLVGSTVVMNLTSNSAANFSWTIATQRV